MKTYRLWTTSHINNPHGFLVQAESLAEAIATVEAEQHSRVIIGQQVPDA